MRYYKLLECDTKISEFEGRDSLYDLDEWLISQARYDTKDVVDIGV